MASVAERIFLYKNDKLVKFTSLTKEEKEQVQTELTIRLTDNIMNSLGYERVEGAHKKGAK